MITNVSMPPEFVATRYPGYFWNLKTKTLFTAKLGVLRELKKFTPNRFSMIREPGYRVSHGGRNAFMSLAYLRNLTPKATVFPVAFTTVKASTNDDVAVDMKNLPAGTRVRVFIEG